MWKYSVVPKKSSPAPSLPYVNVASTLNHIGARVKPLQQHSKEGGGAIENLCDFSRNILCPWLQFFFLALFTIFLYIFVLVLTKLNLQRENYMANKYLMKLQ